MTAEKRALDKDDSFYDVSSLIVDIEGTTTSISFVHDTLFPYVRENLTEYVKLNWTDSEFQEDLKALKEQAKKDEEDGVDGVIVISDGAEEEVRQETIKNVIWQMDNDRKTGALKQLQGHIWRKGYDKGQIVGHIYDDVHESLKSWVDLGKKIYVYSSGSVEAQKLLFGHTKDGDLLNLFAGHFDTAVGAKTDAASYSKILEKIEKTGDDAKTVLFLTDVPKEASAAVEAGMRAVIVSREGNAPLTDDAKTSFQVIGSFADLTFEGKCKRRKMSEPEAITNNDIEKDTTSDKTDVEMKEVDDNGKADATSTASNTEGKVSDNAKQNGVKENVSTDEEAVTKPVESKMDTSEVDSDEKEVKSDAQEECKNKSTEPVENENVSREESKKDEVASCKIKGNSDESKSIEADGANQNNDTTSASGKQDENTKKIEEKENTKEAESCKVPNKEKALDEKVESGEKMDEEAADSKSENGKISDDGQQTEKQLETQTEGAKVSVAANGSSDVDECQRADKTDEKAKEDVSKSEENGSDKNASTEESNKQQVADNAEMNDDSGIADVNKSANQSTLSEKSNELKSEDSLTSGKNEIDSKNEKDSKIDAEKSEKDVKSDESAENGKTDDKEQVNESKGEKAAVGDSIVNGSKNEVDGDKEDTKNSGDAVKDSNTDAVQNGVSHLKNGENTVDNINGVNAKHDETDAKTDVNLKANGNQIAIDEKKVEKSTENSTDTVAV